MPPQGEHLDRRRASTGWEQCGAGGLSQRMGGDHTWRHLLCDHRAEEAEDDGDFQLHIIALNAQKSDAVREASESLYRQASDAGIEVLLDDRAERPGVKFAEADLIGIPHRLIIGDRGLKNGVVEYKQRGDAAAEEVALSDALATLT